MSLHRIGDSLYLNPPGAAGKTVEIAPSYHEQAERLVAAERQGDFYAITAVKHLKALTTGFGGKHNVFISDSGSFRANTYQEVQIYVPNIVATVERRDDDKLLINKIELSPEFGNLEVARNNKPGIYTVTATEKPEYSNDGRIKKESYRPVVIADPRFAKPADAADEIRKRLSKLCGKSVAMVGDFDFFYSPYGKILDGKRCFDATKATEVYAYAGLLADAMEAAKDQHGVTWSSDRGGSVVLTQALQALRLKQQMLGNAMPMFTEANVHIIKMYKAYNDPYVTYNAAKSLGMKADAKILASAHGAHAKLKTIAGNIARIAREKDPHIKTGTLISVGGSTNTYIAATGLLVASGAGVLTNAGMLASIVPILTGVGTAATFYGALSSLYQVSKDRKDGE
ncbi:MAG: hypothetical protein CSH37_14610 [Thalassolituus sp.]|nr:MAG: hypothetical protein CSH37_14610 [Thalassolituus sp.]